MWRRIRRVREGVTGDGPVATPAPRPWPTSRSTSPRPATPPRRRHRPTGTTTGGDRPGTRPRTPGGRTRAARPAATEPDHRGGDHGRDRAGRDDDRARSTRALARRELLPAAALPRLRLPLRRAGRRSAAPLRGHPGHPAAGRPPARPEPVPGSTGPRFTIDLADPHRPPARKARPAPRGARSRQRGTEVIVVKFDGRAPAGPAPYATSAPPPPEADASSPCDPSELHQAQLAAPRAQTTQHLAGQLRHPRRASRAPSTRRSLTGGMRRARYRGLPKVALAARVRRDRDQPRSACTPTVRNNL